ncbi:hypothetical protein LINPERHAP1_LOCUS24119 [Linum perenne]
MNRFTGATSSGNNDDEEKGFIWKLPEIRVKDFGKIGPAFGYGAGCGVGFGVGLIGGFGIGPGIPGLQFGVGLGAGCGVGYGFGYGAGKGVAHDHSRRYSNVGKHFYSPSGLPPRNEIGALVNELVTNAERLAKATSREIEKWRR